MSDVNMTGTAGVSGANGSAGSLSAAKAATMRHNASVGGHALFQHWAIA